LQNLIKYYKIIDCTCFVTVETDNWWVILVGNQFEQLYTGKQFFGNLFVRFIWPGTNSVFTRAACVLLYVFHLKFEWLKRIIKFNRLHHAVQKSVCKRIHYCANIRDRNCDFISIFPLTLGGGFKDSSQNSGQLLNIILQSKSGL
jgi:hypothetical protein